MFFKSEKDAKYVFSNTEYVGITDCLETCIGNTR